MTERSPSELERDAERVRAEIAETAEHLRDKMSPGQLMDEVVDYFKEGDANKILVNLKHQVRDNPLALALVGGGLAWLMMGSGTSAPASRHNVRGGGGARSASMPPGGAREAGTTSSQAASRAYSSSGAGSSGAAPSGAGSSGVGASALGKGFSSAGEAISGAAGKVEDAASAATDTLREGMHDLRDYAGDKASELEHAGSELAESVKHTFFDALEREPLVIGALGVAVGAAIGAMLPATKAEREYLGAAGAKARESAEAALAEGVDKAKHVAADVYSAARDEADRQGLTPGGKPVAEKVADVARAAGDELRSATDKSLKDVEAKADTATDRLSPDRDRG